MRNTFIQGTLSIIFVSLAIIVIVTALIATARTLRHGSGESTEDPAVPSKIYAPAGMLTSEDEKALEAEWAAYHAEHPPLVRRGHH